MAGLLKMVMVNALVPLPPRLSVALKVIEAELTAAVGVPEITPAVLSDKPPGKVPV